MLDFCGQGSKHLGETDSIQNLLLACILASFYISATYGDDDDGGGGGGGGGIGGLYYRAWKCPLVCV